MALNQQNQKDENQLVLSFLAVRRAVGTLGIALPLMLLAFALTPQVPFEPSISEFYFTPAREALVATIGAISVFLFSYTGFSPAPDRVARRPVEGWLTDRRVSLAAGAGALGVAMFPTTCHACTLAPEPFAYGWLGEGISGKLHLASALLFFASLATFCMENFPRSTPDQRDDPKKQSEIRLYRSCGWILIACTASLAVLVPLSDPTGTGFAALIPHLKLVFWVETLALAAFSTSWLVKGDTLTPVVRMIRNLGPDQSAK